MTGALSRKLTRQILKTFKAPKSLSGIVTPLQHPNVIGSGKQAERHLLDYFKWAKKEKLLGRGYEGNIEKIPELGRAYLEPVPKKGIKLLEDPEAVFAMRKIFSPSYNAERLFGVKHNPVREASDALTVYVKVCDDLEQWKNALSGKDRWGLGGFVPDKRFSSGKISVRALEEIVDERPVHKWYNMSCSTQKTIQKLVPKFAKTTDLNESIKLFNTLNRLELAKVKFDSKWMPKFEEMAKTLSKTSSEARIAYAIEGHPEWSWLDPLLSEQEKRVVRLSRNYFVRTRSELLAAGIPVLPSEKGYIPHLATELPGIREKFFRAGKRNYMKKSLDFAHRSPGSVLWFPNWNGIMEYYTKAVSKKLAFQPFHTKWAKFRNKLPHLGKRGEVVSKWWDNWYTSNLDRIGTDFEGKLGKIGNAWVRLEYLRLIGFSLSVGLKHLFKMFGTTVVHGPGPTLKAVPPVAKTVYELTKRTFGKVQPYGPETQLATRYIRSRIALRAIFETPGIKRASMMVERLAANPTLAVEAFDRGVNLFATMEAGLKAGARFEDIHIGILDYIMKINFVGGFDQFTWMKTPWTRAFFMFQMTPAKLFQFRYKLVMDAVKNLRTHGKEGRDIFGKSTGPMLVRAVMMYGLAEAWARQHDMSLLDHILHWPFTTHTAGGETTLFQSPIIDLAYNQIQQHGFSGRGMAMTLRDHFEWMGTASKLAMLYRGELPRCYETEKGLSPEWRLMLGLKSKEQADKIHKRARKIKLRRDIRRIQKYQKRGTFTPKELDKLLIKYLKSKD